MVILITELDEDGREIVSHGVVQHTFEHVVLPNEPPKSLGAIYSYGLGEWVLYNDEDE